ncbi:MAG: ubiquinol-cytochrome C chaperone family protein [Pseudomonadota bacterium]
MLRFFRKKQTNPAVLELYAKAVAQARQPAFYQTFGVPDTLDGRFDMIVFHLWPLIAALNDGEGGITDDGQALFDTFVADMEGNLRSIGVSDNSFPKKMKAIGRAFYGRYAAYATAAGDEATLATAIARNLLEDEEKAGSHEARALALYANAMAVAVGARPLDEPFRYPEPVEFVTETLAKAS